MCRKKQLMLIVTLLFCLSIGTARSRAGMASGTIIVSTFDLNDEGWKVIGDAQDDSVLPNYIASGGASGGYVSAKDDTLGGVWYWEAPLQFLGDQSFAYQRNLGFFLTQSNTSSQFESPDVILAGNGITLTLTVAYYPLTTWTPYNITLSETAGWMNAETDQPATQAEMQAVLQALTTLRIRGEYRSGADTGGLDTVVLGSAPLVHSVFLPTVVK